MILGIDATNIRSGGGLAHLKGILTHANPQLYNIEKIIIWSNNSTLNSLPESAWLEKKSHNYLNRSFFWAFLFQIMYLGKCAKRENCKLILVPGGTFLGNFPNIVSMCRNMLPFEIEEKRRYKGWRNKLRFNFLKLTQSYTFKRSKGIIFLTSYAKNYVTKNINLKCDFKIIPHGVSNNFLNLPKKQKEIASYTHENPFKLLYVSIIAPYKHQWNVAEAVIKLKEEGFPVTLDLVGPSVHESMERLKNILEKDQFKIINYMGLKTHIQVAEIYKMADAFVFASSCENMPNILVEAMTSGLPIACSNKGPMPEVLGSAGLYFDPTKVESVYLCLKELLKNKTLRERIASQSFDKTRNYTWEHCSNHTLEYLQEIANKI